MSVDLEQCLPRSLSLVQGEPRPQVTWTGLDVFGTHSDGDEQSLMMKKKN